MRLINVAESMYYKVLNVLVEEFLLVEKSKEVGFGTITDWSARDKCVSFKEANVVCAIRVK